MSLKLLTKKEALEFIAQTAGDEPLELWLGEDLCFGNDFKKWVQVGKIFLRPSTILSESAIEAPYDKFHAAKFGGFEWHLPNKSALHQAINNALGTLDTDSSKDQTYKENAQKAFYEGFQDTLRRTHLLLPAFDADTMLRFPLRRPMTVVTDTSAVHQGGLDFVSRFLTPWVRIKVPAIVHMEILNQADRYFATRRSLQRKAGKTGSRRSGILREHLLSQGGQRTLLRIELHSDAEMERGDLGADPLRGIVTPDSDPEDQNLKLQEMVRSFADRLIVETARRFQTLVRPGHPLALLTSDQGMARMAMAEGIEVFFFQARSAPQFEGKILTGTLFHPFKPELYTVSLVDVLWEFAVSFGCLALHNPVTGASLELWGIAGGDEVTWQPLHAKDDLLWGRLTPEDNVVEAVNKTQSSTSVLPEASVGKEKVVAELLTSGEQ